MDKFKNIIAGAIFLVFTAGFVYWGWQFFDTKRKLVVSKEDKEIATEKQINILFLGDIMLDRGVEYQVKKNQDHNYPFLEIAGYLKSADLVVANLEGPISDNPQEYATSSFRFNFDRKVLDSLKFAGIGIVSLANNHTLDAGTKGLEQTKNYLKSAEINYFGSPVGCDDDGFFEEKGILFFGINETYLKSCPDSKLEELIKGARAENPDKIMIGFFHWGEEYQSHSNRSQQETARLAIDSGADLIIGSHPHVIQESEKYKNKLIYYSLGNFVFDQNFSRETTEGLILKITAKGNRIIDAVPEKIRINPTFQPEIIGL